jgi:hypothetical protein
VLDEDSQDLEGLFLQHNPLAGLVQFSRLQIEFEDTEANAKWQRVLHPLGEMWGKVYTAPPSVPSEVCSLPTKFNRVSPGNPSRASS